MDRRGFLRSTGCLAALASPAASAGRYIDAYVSIPASRALRVGVPPGVLVSGTYHFVEDVYDLHLRIPPGVRPAVYAPDDRGDLRALPLRARPRVRHGPGEVVSTQKLIPHAPGIRLSREGA